jgi:DNA-binding protein
MTVEENQDRNVVYIGSKPIIAYVMACITQLNNTGAEEIILKARGRAISRCVDVAEVLRRKYFTDTLKIKSIKTDTEEITTRTGNNTNVSSMEIILSKAKEE